MPELRGREAAATTCSQALDACVPVSQVTVGTTLETWHVMLRCSNVTFLFFSSFFSCFVLTKLVVFYIHCHMILFNIGFPVVMRYVGVIT